MKMKQVYLRSTSRGLLLMVLGMALSGIASHASELAKVNESVISDKDLELALGSLSEGQRSTVLKDSNSKHELLLTVIEREVLVQEAEKLKLDQEPIFKDQLSLMRKQLLMNFLLERKFESSLSESSAKKYYEVHKTRFSTEQVHVQHILARDEEDAKAILAKAQEPNADFQALAEKMSKDPSAKNNRGDIGFIGRDRFVPEFTEAAFSTPVGNIVGPIHTTYGYHIIKIVDKRPGKALEYDEVELQVKNALRQELIRNYVESLKGQAKIKVENVAAGK